MNESERIEATPEQRSPAVPPATTYVVVGVVAAAVSAATVAFLFWRKSHPLLPQVENVQQLIERCHTQMTAIEKRLGRLTEPQTTSSV